MSKVVEFRSRHQGKTQAVVTFLEEVLASAKAGELSTVGVAAVGSDGGVLTGYCGNECIYLAGALEFLKQHVLSDAREDIAG